MVVESRTGQVLFAQNPDLMCHPASLTKVMTLYMLFEQLAHNTIRLDSPIPISVNAARQPPTRLGVPAGSAISVDTAIRALVTRSANDVAVAVAEWLGEGSEDIFVERMNRKAAALGMTRTFFQNASGLPNPDQISTARDLIVLGRSIQEHFPAYYPYFSLQSFMYNGTVIRNHNRLLGSIQGVDGIKTGYTRASGFNLLSSARTKDRSILAVVLGGRTASRRDQWMAQLIQEALWGNNRFDHSQNESKSVPKRIQVASPPVVLRDAISPSRLPEPLPMRKPKETFSTEKEKPRPLSVGDIQIGTMATKSQADRRLKEMQTSLGHILAHAKPVTEKVVHKGSVFYRARFIGLSREKADTTCKQIRKSGFQCFVTRG
jgi:D-alanyl-D-alanine carboxypeptidase